MAKGPYVGDTLASSPRMAALLRKFDTGDEEVLLMPSYSGAEVFGRRETELAFEDLRPQVNAQSLVDAATMAGMLPLAPVAPSMTLPKIKAGTASTVENRSFSSEIQNGNMPQAKGKPTKVLSNGNLQAMLSNATGQPSAKPPLVTPPPPPQPVLNFCNAIAMPEKVGEGDSDEYCRVITPEMPMNLEIEESCAMLVECIDMRKKWLFQGQAEAVAKSPMRVHQARAAAAAAAAILQPGQTPDQRKRELEARNPSDLNPNPMEYRPIPASTHTFEMVDGVMAVFQDEVSTENLFPVPGTAAEFFTSMHRMLRYGAMGPVKSFCHHRLMLLEQKFNLHVMLNSDKEFLAQKAAPHRDFYNVRKVDTHIHHSACMHQKHLLRFIKSKLRKEPDEVVIFRDGKYLTLSEVFHSLKLTGHDLNVDTLDMHADKSLFHRFDRFNLKYNPCGQSRLREIFIKQDNLLHGRFLAEVTQEVLADLEASKYQHAEMRISIYGRKAMEWDILASWVVANNLYSDNNVWLIQIPRLYNLYKDSGVIDNFQQMLDNIFEPLFEVTRDPATHPQLHILLQQVVGFDMVDDESKPERRPTKHSAAPADWNSKHNCAYSYYAYYIYANLFSLNKFRESRGLNTFTFRPHAGEAGDVDHLASAFMLCENIAHGINLRKSPLLQYLFYLAQIGLCMSPLSNNSLFLDYHRNPFPTFFARGLSVSLSTDDPLQIHLTKEPLVEEYSVAAQVWKLTSADLCEVARNGVLHSGFPHACKMHWTATEYWRPGPDGNDIHKTNVPNMRMQFRYDTYMDEMRLVAHGALNYGARKSGAKE